MTVAGLRGGIARSGRSAGRAGDLMWSRRRAWRWGVESLRAAGIDAAAAPLEAEVLLRHAAGISREELLARPDTPLRARPSAVYRRWIAQRAASVPIGYLIGQREFFGLALVVGRGVLIPRPETEHLVETVVGALRTRPAPAIADIGTGSGAIAIALARALPAATVLATDISERALRLARRNAARCGVASRIRWARGEALRPLARVLHGARLDALVSNPPYIPASELADLPREIREHEPLTALDGGPDGLAIHRQIVAGAAAHLRPGGVIALEVAGRFGQAKQVAALIAATGRFGAPCVVRDYADLERVVIAARGADGRYRD